MKTLTKFLKSLIVFSLIVTFSACTKEIIKVVVVTEKAKVGGLGGIIYSSGVNLQIENNNMLPLFPLDSVTIVASNSDTTMKTLSDQTGLFSFINVTPGEYEVQMSHKKSPDTLKFKASVEIDKYTTLTNYGYNCIYMSLSEIKKKKWTFIHLVNNSVSNLVNANSKTIARFERDGGSGEELYNVAFFDNGNENNAQLYYLTKPNYTPYPDPIDDPFLAVPILSPCYTYDGTGNAGYRYGDLGDAVFVKNLIKNLASLYPSDSVALFFHSHGSGIEEDFDEATKGISPNINTKKYISVNQMGEIFRTLNREGVNVKTVGFNACLMGMSEVYYELYKSGIRYAIASENETGNIIDITQTNKFIEDFIKGTGTSTSMGHEIVNSSTDGHALIDLYKGEEYFTLFNDFAKKLNQTDIKIILPIIKETQLVSPGAMQAFLAYNYYDIGDFAKRISTENFTDEAALKESADKLYKYIKNRSGMLMDYKLTSVENKKNQTGISVMMLRDPIMYDKVNGTYRKLNYYLDGNKDWDSFLQKINWSTFVTPVWDGSATKPETITETDVYILKPSDLAWVAQQVNSGASSFAGKTITLKRNIDMGGANKQNWAPIGNLDRPFQGVLNGEGKQIQNLYIESNNSEYLGLFGAIKDAVIENLELNNAVFVCNLKSTDTEKNLYIGGLAATMINIQYPALIKNCHINIKITAVSDGCHSTIGGIFGVLRGVSEIQNCTSSGLIESTAKQNYSTSIGGIIGECMSSGNPSEQTVIGECKIYSGTEVKAICEGLGNAAIGGIIGFVSSDNVSVATTSVSAQLNGISNGDATIGGIIGATSPDATATIINSKVNNTITGTITTPGENKYAYIGGIAGRVSANIFGCESNCTLSSSSNNAGGISGHHQSGLISSCSAIGSSENVWGIAGKSDIKCTINHCYYISNLGISNGGTINESYKYSQTNWPTTSLPGWNLINTDGTPPVGWNKGATWQSKWKETGGWNKEKSTYPSLNL
jgi:hypothetical protein